MSIRSAFLPMHLTLMIGVTARFQLQRGVRDVEVTGQTELESVQNLRGVTRVEAPVLNRDVGGQGGGARRQRPRVEVVNVKNVVHVDQVRSDVVQVEVAGRGLQEDVAR